MCKEEKYINIQTSEELDLDRVSGLKDNALLRHRPVLFNEWNFEKNNNLGFDIYKSTKSQGIKTWWICSKGHEWNSFIYSRTIGQNCPYCSGRYATRENNLVKFDSKLAKEWHPTLNGELTPNDVTPQSSKKVWWLGECGHEWYARICNRKGLHRKCPYCSGKKVDSTNSLASLNPELASEWHPTKNIDLTPHDVTCGSNKRVWWIGKECGHEWDALINSRHRDNPGCPYCAKYNTRLLIGFNDMWTTNPKLASLLADPEDGYKYTQSSNKKVNWKCLNCNEIIKNRGINDINFKQKLSCVKCSDGKPFTEKVVYNLLKQLGVCFEWEIVFKWSQNKRYDFYIPTLNAIIEVHGIQHYKQQGRKGARTLEEEQENDKFKERLAKENGINRYIVIDARKSELEWIKNSIMSSELTELFDLSDVYWEEIHENSLKSLIKETCDLWNNGIHSTSEIMDILKIARVTTIDYLKKGKASGICDYDVEVAIKNSSIIPKRKVVQLNENGLLMNIFDSMTNAASEVKRSHSSISRCCRGEVENSGGYKWMYKEDYEKYIEEQKQLA